MVDKEELLRELTEANLELRNAKLERDLAYVELRKVEEGDSDSKYTVEELEEHLLYLEKVEGSLELHVREIKEHLDKYEDTEGISSVITHEGAVITCNNVYMERDRPLRAMGTGIRRVVLKGQEFELLKITINTNADSEREGERMYLVTDGRWRYDIYDKDIAEKIPTPPPEYEDIPVEGYPPIDEDEEIEKEEAEEDNEDSDVGKVEPDTEAPEVEDEEDLGEV